MKRKRTDREKLRMWQDRLSANEERYSHNYAAMDRREELYRGDNSIQALIPGDERTSTPHVRNICAELVEAQVSSSVPAPKVTPRRKRDELLAKLIEDWLRNEDDRLPTEENNDMMERTVPIQGGAGFLVEWDNTQRSHTTVGEVSVSTLHPRQILPQDGVYSGIEDMDYVFLKIPATKEYIQRRYGVSVRTVAESEPEVKGGEHTAAADDMVTMYCAYYRNEKGGIGLFSWVDETIVEDLEDYQARRLRKCAMCGAPEPMEADPLEEQTLDGTNPAADETVPLDDAAQESVRRYGSARRNCPYCGSTKWETEEQDYEEIYIPIVRRDGTVIPGVHPVERVNEELLDENGLPTVEVVMEPTRIPSYKPNIYPVILQKNVSVYGKFLGESDIDKIETNQNAINRIHAKMIDKLCAAGSFVTLPIGARIKVDGNDMRVLNLKNAADLALISVQTMEGDISQDEVYLEQLYQESRQGIGITDSFQGRRDATATSGKAKEFSAAQTAGRLESKRIMKEAAHARRFEAMFKFWLAYADEPRPVVSRDVFGEVQYEELNRYDFLEQDAAGQWYWNDQFLFSCDTSAPLASNREAMWQETRMNFESGAFGNPTQIQTLMLFWTKMEALHYPEAGATKEYFRRLQEQQQLQAAAAQQQQAEIARMQAQLQARQEPQAAPSAVPHNQESAAVSAEDLIMRR